MSRAKKRKSSYFTLKLFIVVLALLFLAGTLFVYYPALFFRVPTGFTAAASEQQGGESLSGNVINIALLGFDRSASKDNQYSIFRPDTIMIASINLRNAEVKLVNIPRDSYVQIAGTEIYDKINHSYMYGYYSAGEDEDMHLSGLKTTLMTIRDFLGGMPVHGYISIDMDGAATIIDSIGGIYYDVEFDVRSDFGRGRVLVEEGYQLLDGENFMQYVRTRAAAQGGERGRSGRQQNILITMFDQLRGPAGIIKIPLLLNALRNNVETELNSFQISALGIFGLRVNPAEIETFIFSGQGRLSDRNGQNIWYLVIDEEKRVEIIREVFGVTVEKRPPITLPGPVAPESETPEPDPPPILEPDQDPEPDPEPDTPEENDEEESGEEESSEENTEENEVG